MGRFILKALTGPLKGRSFRVRSGLKIGRSSGDIVLKDQMVSHLHAEIQIYSNGKIMIVDKDSKNKIIMNNQRIDKSVLEKGSSFKIGRTVFELDFVQEPEELLAGFIAKQIKGVQDQPLLLKPFAREIELDFIEGLQKGQSYYLAYGPRFFGSGSVDFPIFEKEAPEKAFALAPDKKSDFFVTKHPKSVRLNGKAVQKAKIKSGDQILIGGAVLKISLKRGL